MLGWTEVVDGKFDGLDVSLTAGMSRALRLEASCRMKCVPALAVRLIFTGLTQRAPGIQAAGSPRPTPSTPRGC